jgi:hypothetical protein
MSVKFHIKCNNLYLGSNTTWEQCKANSRVWAYDDALKIIGKLVLEENAWLQCNNAEIQLERVVHYIYAGTIFRAINPKTNMPTTYVVSTTCTKWQHNGTISEHCVLHCMEYEYGEMTPIQLSIARLFELLQEESPYGLTIVWDGINRVPSDNLEWLESIQHPDFCKLIF